MLSARGARNVCPRYRAAVLGVLERNYANGARLPRLRSTSDRIPHAITTRRAAPVRTFSTTVSRAKDAPPESAGIQKHETAADGQEQSEGIPADKLDSLRDETENAVHPVLPESDAAIADEVAGAEEYVEVLEQELVYTEENAIEGPGDVEKVVRDAKQRFRDTLPKGYLNEEEYKLYERLYGPPLRETEPDDVGIPTHSDMIEGGAGYQPYDPDEVYEVYEEETGDIVVNGQEQAEEHFEEQSEDQRSEEQPEEQDAEQDTERSAEEPRLRQDGYVEIVARNQREYDALLKLEKDFIATAEKAKEMEALEREKLQEGQEEKSEVEMEFDEFYSEGGTREYEEDYMGVRPRAHPYSEAGRFGTSPGTIQLPKGSLVEPITQILSRTDLGHIREAAETVYGGPGLPDSAITPPGMKNRKMVGIPLPPSHRRMTEINADVFMSIFFPQMYATSTSVLTEVRKRLGTEWMRGLLSRGDREGPRVLDVGSGGAGLAAWQNVLDAEWELMKEEGIAWAPTPPGKKSTVIGGDRLRERVNLLIHDTTFLPRLPDYHHSVENAERVLDGPQVPLPRKTYDVIIASHQLLQAPEGHRRKAVLNSLWSLLSTEGGVLIILEKGHPRGFEAVAEMRSKLLEEYLIHDETPPGTDTDLTGFRRAKEPGMVIAPCTTHRHCPLYLVPGKSKGRKDVCSFSQRFIRPPFLQRIMEGNDRNHDDVEFSYLAVRRGVPLHSSVQQGPEAADRAFKGYVDDAVAPPMLSLPRTIAPPLKRKKHIILDMCTPAGRLERWTVPHSFGKQAYRDARKSRWGDLWALGAKTRTAKKVRLGKEGGKPKVIEVDLSRDGIADVREKGRGNVVEKKRKGKKQSRSLLEELEDEERER